MVDQNKRALIASGGTGGHFYPGLAMANELRSHGWEPLFLVKKNDISIPALTARAYPYVELDMRALPRSLNPAAHAVFLLGLIRSLFSAMKIIEDFNPRIVFGTGSYIAFPAILAAALKGVPSLIHESNAKLGLANRLCAFFASATALGLPIKDPISLNSPVLTGTPVRENFLIKADAPAVLNKLGFKPDKPITLIFGGSQGAKRINQAIVSAITALHKNTRDLQFIHITGRRDHAEILEQYKASGIGSSPAVKVLDYFENMAELYAVSSLICSRSGASTVAELLHTKKPAILIPFPTSAGGHQRANAECLSNAGAAILLEETPALDVELRELLTRLLTDMAELQRMGRNYDKISLPAPADAPSNILKVMEKIIWK